MTQAEIDVLAEREKQRAKWGDGHDNKHDRDDLARAAGHIINGGWVFESWPADLRRKHPKRRDQLVIAAALLLAEIERLDRAGGE